MSSNLGDTYVRGLVVLHDTAQSTLGSAQSGVQAVNVLLDVVSLGDSTVSNVKVSALVVGTVGARNELLVLSLEGEPRLQVVLLGGSVVESTGNDGNNTVGKAKGLVELLGVGDHVVKGLPRLLGLSDDKLLDLLELVDTEDTPGILSVGTGLTTVTGGESSVRDGEVLLLEPLVGVESGNRLLRGGDKVLVVGGVTVNYLVKLLVELLKLGSLGHHVLEHELGGLERNVSLAGEELETVVDQGLVEEDSPLLEEVTTVTDNLNSTLGLVTVKASENIVVGENVALLNGNTLGGPGTEQLVVVLVVADGNSVVDKVSDGSELLVHLGLLSIGSGLKLLLLGLKLDLLSEKLSGVLLGLCRKSDWKARHWEKCSTFFFNPISFWRALASRPFMVTA